MDWQGFRESMTAMSKERRADNRHNSADILRRHSVAFQTKNDGAHLIVKHAGKVADLWPGTGKYQVRGTGKYRRGVFNLLRDLGVAIQQEARG